MIFADVKAMQSNKKEETGGCIFELLLKVPSKRDIQCKKSVYFSFNFGWYSIQLDYYPLRTGSVGGFHLKNKIR